MIDPVGELERSLADYALLLWLIWSVTLLPTLFLRSLGRYLRPVLVLLYLAVTLYLLPDLESSWQLLGVDPWRLFTHHLSIVSRVAGFAALTLMPVALIYAFFTASPHLSRGIVALFLFFVAISLFGRIVEASALPAYLAGLLGPDQITLPELPPWPLPELPEIFLRLRGD